MNFLVPIYIFLHGRYTYIFNYVLYLNNNRLAIIIYTMIIQNYIHNNEKLTVGIVNVFLL